MTHESSAGCDWKAEHLALYLASGGAEGHILDTSSRQGKPLVTHCLIRLTGRKSGRTIITPLIYATWAGEVVLCASNGGAERHPSWYLNLIASHEVELQIATQAFCARWREPEGTERERVWSFMVSVFPKYAVYQAVIARRIPVLMLAVSESIPVFRPA